MESETEHMIRTLRTAMRSLGFTNREIEKRMGVSGGYLTRLFSGVMELRFEHIVQIARIMGMEPAEIFQLAYPPSGTPPTEASQRLRELGDRLHAGATAPATASLSSSQTTPSTTELEQEMEKLFMRMFQKFLANMVKGAGGPS
jgi:transcriptional regulator with XRE-family HTH domain